MKRPRDPLAYHLMAKPSGAICNLDCAYCFYLEKEHLYPAGHRFQMPDDVLEAYVRQYIATQDAPEVTFAWQGGEPTLMGVGFFRRAVEFQRRHAAGRAITNSIQTNGVMLDDEWCRFLAENRFLVGLSVDGPRELHDAYRVDKHGKPTFDKVIAALERMQRHGVEFNTLTVVHRLNAERPLDVYRFLRETGSEHHQYIPLVERLPDDRARALNLDLAPPPAAGDSAPAGAPPVTEWTVGAEQYGRFLVTIFDEWVRNDVGRVFVQLFESALAAWHGEEIPLCYFRETCGRALVIEHDGKVFSCDHYVYPEYEVGDVRRDDLRAVVLSGAQQQFGRAKRDTLPDYCRRCDVRFACNGECPKHRFIRTPDGEPGLNYLCAGYKMFFTHVAPYMREMSALLHQQRSPALVMPFARRLPRAAGRA